jgi:hypothetical protein
MRAIFVFVVAGVAAAAGSLASSAHAMRGAEDRLLVLDVRAGPYRYLDAFHGSSVDSYEAAVAAFGAPARFRERGNICDVTWPAAGIRVGFASVPHPCATAALYQGAWYGMSLFGDGWHTRTGVRVGGTLQQVRRAYPRASFDGSGTLNLIVKHEQEFTFVKLAARIDRGGHVRSIEVPAAYIY